jgi:hypothetical protein
MAIGLLTVVFNNMKHRQQRKDNTVAIIIHIRQLRLAST